MRRLHAMAMQISRLGVYFGGTLLLLASFLITFEVIARRLFGFSIQGADELTGYALAIGIAWSFASALFSRSHIKVDAIYVLFPRPVQAVLDVISLASFGAVIAVVCWQGWEVLAETVRFEARSTTPLQTPLIVPQGLWYGGMVFFLICILILLAVTSRALVRGDLAEVRRLAGAPSVKEGASEEAQHAAEVHKASREGPR